MKISLIGKSIILVSYLIFIYTLRPANSQTANSCEPIGRVRSSTDSNYPQGSQICANQLPSPNSSKNVSFFCYWSAKTLSLFDLSWHPSGCPVNTLVEPCPDGSYINCSLGRGLVEDSSIPKVLTPYGNKLIKSRPIITWTNVFNATKYLVQVRNENTGWERVVTRGTNLSYPTQEKPLESSSSYRIKVSAYNNNTFITSFTKRLIIVSDDVKKQIDLELSKIKLLDLPNDEIAYRDIFSVYNSRGLIDEEVKVLKARIAEGGTDPGLRRALGDSYLLSGLTDYASKEYKIASTWAERSKNTLELTKARSGLLLISQYKVSRADQTQFPINMNGAHQ